MNSLKILMVTALTIGTAFVAAPSASATTDKSNCADASIRSNLRVIWKDSGSITVGTVGDKPVCKDTTVYFSSYTMPDNYNGKPFRKNPTATPQIQFDSASAILRKDTAKPLALSIKTPASCKNAQVDVYYGPEIKTVGPLGHGSQYISGKIIAKSEQTCQAAEQPKPVVTVPQAEAQQPPTPAGKVDVLAASTVVTPAELPHTGPSSVFTLGAALSGLTYGGSLLLRRRP